MKQYREEFKECVMDCLMSKYQLSEKDTVECMKNEYFNLVMKIDPEGVLHDSVEFWAEFLYKEYMK